MFADNTKYFVGFGFATVIALMVLLSVWGAWSASAHQLRLERLNVEHDARTDLVLDMPSNTTGRGFGASCLW